ncbi:MAG: hypothetical protein R2697_00200 [Ilumatobacteraceae bacterium]
MSGRPSGDPSMRWNEHAYGSWDEMSMGDGRHRRLTIAYAVAAAVAWLPVPSCTFFLRSPCWSAEWSPSVRHVAPQPDLPHPRLRPDPAEIDLDDH